MKSYEDTTDVVVLAIYHAEEDGNYYLIARRRKNEFWEFVVGKVKKGESYEEAALRELEDEIEIDWDLDAVEVKKVGEPYKSPENPVYDLYPVLLGYRRRRPGSSGTRTWERSMTALRG